MGLNARLKRLERLLKPQQGYQLYSPAGDDLTDAEIVSVPTAKALGVARLANGTEKAVIMKGKACFVFNADKLTDKLWWIQDNDGPVFYFGTGLTEDDV